MFYFSHLVNVWWKLLFLSPKRSPPPGNDIIIAYMIVRFYSSVLGILKWPWVSGFLDIIWMYTRTTDNTLQEAVENAYHISRSYMYKIDKTCHKVELEFIVKKCYIFTCIIINEFLSRIGALMTACVTCWALFILAVCAFCGMHVIYEPSKWPSSPRQESLCSSEFRAPDGYIGSNGFESHHGLRLFPCLMLVTCWKFCLFQDINIFSDADRNSGWIYVLIWKGQSAEVCMLNCCLCITWK